MAAKKSTRTKEDVAAYQKAWRAANKEKRKADGAAYYKENKESMNRAAAERYRADPDSYKARAKRWAEANPGRRYEITSKWRSEHPEIYALSDKRSYENNKDVWLARSKSWRTRNPGKMRALREEWKADNPGAVAHHVNLRRTRKMQATPVWADLEAIKAIYKQAAMLRKQTGEDWHVDHRVPLKHPLVCGFHNEFNLRVIPARENHEKKNKFVV